jgi:hypothetical protein
MCTIDDYLKLKDFYHLFNPVRPHFVIINKNEKVLIVDDYIEFIYINYKPKGLLININKMKSEPTYLKRQQYLSEEEFIKHIYDELIKRFEEKTNLSKLTKRSDYIEMLYHFVVENVTKKSMDKEQYQRYLNFIDEIDLKDSPLVGNNND